MYIYATHPICNIIGEVTVVGCLSGPPEILWKKVSNRGAGLCKEEFYNYFFNCKVAYAFELCNPVIYRYPVPLSKIYITYPPQSFYYLNEQQCHLITFYSNHFEQLSFFILYDIFLFSLLHYSKSSWQTVNPSYSIFSFLKIDFHHMTKNRKRLIIANDSCVSTISSNISRCKK